MRYYFTAVRMAAIQKSTSNKCWRGVAKREPSYSTVGREYKTSTATMENQCGDSLKNWK